MLIRTTLIALLALAAAASAQPPAGGRGRGRFGADPAFQGNGPGGVRFLGAEAGLPGRLVKNAPYTADVITETVQTLPDGNHIRQTTTVHVARDSEGRTRREQSLKTLSGLAPNSNLPQVVFINDPVASTNYALDTTGRTATRSTFNRPASREGRPEMRRPDAATPPNAVGAMHEPRGSNPNVKTESLGHQTIEGVAAEGRRSTWTIPAGQLGNEQPIQVVTETWYSPDLQTVVLLKRTDPRSGETVTRVSNVSRSEPPHTLFEVPADYKILESARPGRGPGAPRPTPGATKQ